MITGEKVYIISKNYGDSLGLTMGRAEKTYHIQREKIIIKNREFNSIIAYYSSDTPKRGFHQNDKIHVLKYSPERHTTGGDFYLRTDFISKSQLAKYDKFTLPEELFEI